MAAILLLSLLPPRASGQCSYGQEGVAGFTPGTGIAGVTRVYIYGNCFGDLQGTGSVKVGGVQIPSSDIVLWTDYLIQVVLPFEVQTGFVEVDSQDNGSSDSSSVNASFTVLKPSHPSLIDPNTGLPNVDPSLPSSVQYAEGTWNYSSCNNYDGYCAYLQYNLAQGGRNSDGSYDISGTMNWWDNGGSTPCSDDVYGTLTSKSVLIINPDTGYGTYCQYWGEAWIVLNSGDTTSWGYTWLPGSFCGSPPDANFPTDVGSPPGDPCALWDNSLFKSQTELPSTETPAFLGWVGTPSYPDPTFGAWQRTLPSSQDGLAEFSGRFVFEQVAPGGSGVDGCYSSAIAQIGFDPWSPHTNVTGGGWFVNANGIWGSGQSQYGTNLLYSDPIGISSDQVQWYQAHVSLCEITLQQTMFIDSVSSPIAYNTGGQYLATNQLEIDITTIPGEGICTSVTPNGGSTVTACRDYPPQ